MDPFVLERIMSYTYAIGDLHGRYDLLLKAEEAIEKHLSPVKSSTIVYLGDYIDRGPQSRQIIEFLMNKLSDNFTMRIVLGGNHEDIMLKTCRVLKHANWWISNGGGHTLISYGHSRTGPVDLSVVPDAHLDWISKLPLLYTDGHRVFVHAGVDPDVPLKDQSPETLTWKLYQDFDERGHGDHHVVHGHHQFSDGPLLKKGRTDLDTLAWMTGRLVVGVFDDDVPGGPVDLLEVLGPAGGRLL